MQKNNFQLVVFDLDGTLMDSGINIFEATKSTLNIMDIKYEIDWIEFKSLIGEHFEIIFEKFNIKVDFNKFIEIYKNLYFDFIDTTKLYDGCIDILKFLKKRNILTAILTTKGQDQLDKLLSHFDIKHLIDLPMGRRAGIAIKPDPEPLSIICNTLGINPQKTLFAGDTDIDIQCGKSAGSFTCAATYGYRTKSQLTPFSPDFFIDSLCELKKFF